MFNLRNFSKEIQSVRETQKELCTSIHSNSKAVSEGV